MKRIFVLSLICLLTFSSITFASVNGDYKGYPKVNVNVDGQEYNSNVPAIMFNGTTMVPVRFVGESLGSEVKWDNNSYTVTIKDSKSDLSKIKEYNKKGTYYVSLQLVGSGLTDVAKQLTSSMNKQSIDNASNSLNQQINFYNNNLNIINNTYPNDSELQSVLNDYYNAIEYLKVATDKLYDYYEYGNKDTFQEYVNNVEMASNLSLGGTKKSYDGYLKMSNLIENQ